MVVAYKLFWASCGICIAFESGDVVGHLSVLHFVFIYYLPSMCVLQLICKSSLGFASIFSSLRAAYSAVSAERTARMWVSV